MGSASRYECFCVDPSERLLFAGNLSGQIDVIDIDSFTTVAQYQGHSGTIHAVSAHPVLPFVAAIGNDRKLSLWRRNEDNSLTALTTNSFRDIACSNDENLIDPIFSHSVALGFHDTEPRLVTRTGNGGTMELDFDEAGTVSLRWALRLHGDWDVQMTRFECGGDRVLSAGRDASLVLVDGGCEVRRWQFGDVVAHWAEHVEGTTYLVASDLGLVAKLDIDSTAPPVMGRRFARDDMEFLTFNKTSKRTFCTSFDRNVYELDHTTLVAKGVVFEPGYKCVWAKSLEREPDTLIVQSRNGTLFKYDLHRQEINGRLKHVPDALWSAAAMEDGSVIAAGEGSSLSLYSVTGFDAQERAPTFSRSLIATDVAPDSYTKRMVYEPISNRLVLGRTDGELWAGARDNLRRIADLGSGIRDVAINSRRGVLYVATEDGRIVEVDWDGHNCITRYQDVAEPFPRAVWALAYNPATDQLAYAKFGKTLNLINASDFENIAEIECDRVKRIRWLSSDQLLFGSSDAVVLFNTSTGQSRNVAEQMQNTIEDFIWDQQQHYLVTISYQCTIGLFDLSTGDRLDNIRDQLDYSKGIAWLNPGRTDSYPMDFITWGRSGSCYRYRIHNERIVAMGMLAPKPAQG